MATLNHFKSVRFSITAMLVLLMCGTAMTVSAGEARKRPIKKLTFDPAAKKVELFSGIEDGAIEYKMIMKNSKEGMLLLENKTDEAISVGMPTALVGVQIFPQFGGAGGGGGAGGQGGQGGGQGGGQQAVGGGGQGGGGQGGGGFGGGQGGGGGGGFFSIPAEKVIAVPLNTVCLEYGKREPSARSTYKLIRPEEYSDSKTLHELLVLVASGRINQDVAQASAWHVSSKMSWAELASKVNNKFGAAGPRRLFSNAHLFAAQNVVAAAKAKAAEDKDEQPRENIPSRTSRVSK